MSTSSFSLFREKEYPWRYFSFITVASAISYWTSHYAKVYMCVNPTFGYAYSLSIPSSDTNLGWGEEVPRAPAPQTELSSCLTFSTSSSPPTPHSLLIINIFLPFHPAPLVAGHNQLFGTSLMFHFTYFATCVQLHESSQWLMNMQFSFLDFTDKIDQLINVVNSLGIPSLSDSI